MGFLPLNIHKATGITVSVNTMVIGVPKKITVPIGFQSALLLRTIGNTPIVAAAEVRKMGRILRFADCKLACMLLRLSDVCISSA